MLSEVVADILKATVSLNGRQHISSNAVRTRTLCRRHNRELSDYDAEAGRFFGALDVRFRNAESRINGVIRVDGWKFERWCLKTFVNLATFEGVISREDPLWHARGANLVEYLYRSTPLPDNWGLYIFPAGTLHPHSYRWGHRPDRSQVFALDVMRSQTRVFRRATRKWTDYFALPIWLHMRTFAQDFGFVANITPFGDEDFSRFLAGLRDEPRKYAQYRPETIEFKGTVRISGGEPQKMTPFTVQFDWSSKT